MTTIAPQGAPIPEQSGDTVIRIMRFMPLMLPMPVRVEPRVGSRSLIGLPPMRVWISGKIIVGGFGARLTCRKVADDTHLPVDEATTEQIALPSSRAVAIAPRSIGRTANDRSPGLWVQFIDGAGSPLTQRA